MTLRGAEQNNRDSIRDWCLAALPVLEQVEKQEAVKTWCREEYSAYCATAGEWQEWERKLYDVMHTAYQAGVVCPEYRELLEKGAVSFPEAVGAEERLLERLEPEVLWGVMALLIRMDYGSNGSFIRAAVGEGKLLRVLSAYLKKTK